jgi:hypothetical protein
VPVPHYDVCDVLHVTDSVNANNDKFDYASDSAVYDNTNDKVNSTEWSEQVSKVDDKQVDLVAPNAEDTLTARRTINCF